MPFAGRYAPGRPTFPLDLYDWRNIHWSILRNPSTTSSRPTLGDECHTRAVWAYNASFTQNAREWRFTRSVRPMPSAHRPTRRDKTAEFCLVGRCDSIRVGDSVRQLQTLTRWHDWSFQNNPYYIWWNIFSSSSFAYAMANTTGNNYKLVNQFSVIFLNCNQHFENFNHVTS